MKEFPFGGWNLSHGPPGIVGTGGGPNLCAKPGWCLDVFGFEVIDSYNSVIIAIQTIVACEPSTNNWLYSDMIRVRIF